MSTPNKYQPTTNVPPPRCPYCAQDLLEVGAYQWSKQVSVGIAITLCIYCPNLECRKVLGTNTLVVPHAVEDPSRIVPPH